MRRVASVLAFELIRLRVPLGGALALLPLGVVGATLFVQLVDARPSSAWMLVDDPAVRERLEARPAGWPVASTSDSLPDGATVANLAPSALIDGQFEVQGSGSVARELREDVERWVRDERVRDALGPAPAPLVTVAPGARSPRWHVGQGASRGMFVLLMPAFVALLAGAVLGGPRRAELRLVALASSRRDLVLSGLIFAGGVDLAVRSVGELAWQMVRSPEFVDLPPMALLCAHLLGLAATLAGVGIGASETAWTRGRVFLASALVVAGCGFGPVSSALVPGLGAWPVWHALADGHPWGWVMFGAQLLIGVLVGAWGLSRILDD